MKSFEKLLLNNKAWAEEKVILDTDYFSRLSKIQKPDFLWIGCSDSRVPANDITGTEPGEIFVHRNIANLVQPSDTNILSVLEYSVLVLRVKHVIVCGHYGCGGVLASMKAQQLNSLNHWLNNLRETYDANRPHLEAIESTEKRADRLTELSVETQIENLARTDVIQRAWKELRQPILHGLLYRLSDGILQPICRKEPDVS